MSKVKIQGHASGTGVLTVTAPNTSTDRTITLPDGDVTLGAATPSITDNGNATAITIDSSENVGIGNTSPSTELHIGGGTAGQSPELRLQSATVYTKLTADDTSGNSDLDFSHTLRVKEAGTEVMRVAAGNVTMPSQPAFFTEQTTTQSNISVGAWHAVNFGTESFDQGGDLSGSTFTAPVTGKYQFNTSLRIASIDTSGSIYHLRFDASNRSPIVNIDPDQYATDTEVTFQLSSLIDMDASDTVTVQVYQQTGTVQTDIVSGIYSHFSGYLVC